MKLMSVSGLHKCHATVDAETQIDIRLFFRTSSSWVLGRNIKNRASVTRHDIDEALRNNSLHQINHCDVENDVWEQFSSFSWSVPSLEFL